LGGPCWASGVDYPFVGQYFHYGSRRKGRGRTPLGGSDLEILPGAGALLGGRTWGWGGRAGGQGTPALLRLVLRDRERCLGSAFGKRSFGARCGPWRNPAGGPARPAGTLNCRVVEAGRFSFHRGGIVIGPGSRGGRGRIPAGARRFPRDRTADHPGSRPAASQVGTRPRGTEGPSVGRSLGKPRQRMGLSPATARGQGPIDVPPQGWGDKFTIAYEPGRLARPQLRQLCLQGVRPAPDKDSDDTSYRLVCSLPAPP